MARRSSSINHPAFGRISLEDIDRIAPVNISDDLDTSPFEFSLPIWRLWTLVKADIPNILIPCSDHNPTESGPWDRA